MADFSTALVRYIPLIKWGAVFFFAIFVFGAIIYYLVVIRPRRKWIIEVHEQKADGRIHTVGYDTLIERKLNWGTKVIYWMKKAKTEVIPPPDETVDRYKGKEEVDYLRIEREFIPVKKTVKTDYTNPIVRAKLTIIYDNILNKIRGSKTPDDARHRWIYIPCNRTLSANIDYNPIPYDMNMMAMNEIHNADEFFQSKYEFWKKYGAVIVFGITVVFLIILIVLSFDYIENIINTSLGSINNVVQPLDRIAEKIGTTPPPS